LQGVSKGLPEQDDAPTFTPEPEKQSRLSHNQMTWLALGVVVVAVGWLLWAFPSSGAKFSTTPSYTDSDYDAGMACTMAEKLIKPQLKAPSTAQFDYGSCRDGATHSGNTWHLTSYVDADNSFGAHIRNYYTVDMTNVPPSDMWNMDNLIFLDN
jgi:hypothetical protein